MDALAERLDSKLREWQPEAADIARERITEIINATDQGAFGRNALAPRGARRVRPHQ